MGATLRLHGLHVGMNDEDDRISDELSAKNNTAEHGKMLPLTGLVSTLNQFSQIQV